jgi:hypothetical protein
VLSRSSSAPWHRDPHSFFGRTEQYLYIYICISPPAQPLNLFERGREIARVLADSSGAPLGGTPTMPLPGQTKAESDQERIANILQVMNANLATVAKTMIDARPIGGSANGAVSRSGQIGM